MFETQRANAVDHLRFAYAKDAQGLPQTVVMRYNAQGQAEQQTYNFIVQGHVTRPSALSVPTGQSGYAQQTVYDAKGLKIKHIQQDGRVIFYSYNAKGRITREATYPASLQSATTAPPLSQAESVSSTQWHGTWNLPLKTAEAYLITSYSYDGKGNLLELIETPTSDTTGAKGFNATPSGDTQATRWTYDAKNLPTTIVELVGSTETGRWDMTYNAAGDLTGITDVISETVATLVPQGNGISQVTEITPQASPAVSSAMATVRTQGVVRPMTGPATPLVVIYLPAAAEAAAGGFATLCANAAVRLGVLSIAVGDAANTVQCAIKPERPECEKSCDPPAGTQCYEYNSGHQHKGYDPHYHIWQQNRISPGNCLWNKKRSRSDTYDGTQPPPAGLMSCETYSSWMKQKGI